jgi:IS605 OrfB family transposase
LKEIKITIIGKVFNANKNKILIINQALEKYFKLVKWYIDFNNISKKELHNRTYEKAKEMFDLNTALIQTARDKAIEIMKSFNELKRKTKINKPILKRIAIRFDERCYKFDKTNNVLTPYWLTLSVNKEKRISLPIVFGEKQKQRIEEALKNEWKFATVEMVKLNKEWYAHFVLKKTISFINKPETIVAVDIGEHNLATATKILINNPSKPIQGRFWKGAEIKKTRGLYSHIRRKLMIKRLLKEVKRFGEKERKKINQLLHTIANQIINYAKQSTNPVITMEDITHIREKFNKGRKLNKRFHSLPFRKLQTYIEYKALLNGIQVYYLPKNLVKNSSKTCHRCGHVAKVVGREIKCPNCGLRYNRDLNACINIAHRLMRSMGWGSCEPPEPAYEEIGVNPTLNAGSFAL